MYLGILKKDLKRRKTMNVILLLFVILAVMFTAAGFNNLLAVLSGTDGYIKKSEIPDLIIAVEEQYDKQTEESFSNLDGMKSYKRSTLPVLLDESISLENGKKFKSGGNGISIFQSVEKTLYNVFDSENRKITQVEKGSIYIPAYILEKNELSTGDKITLKSGDTTLNLKVAGSCKDILFGSPYCGIAGMIMNEEDFEVLNSAEDCTSYIFFTAHAEDFDLMMSEYTKAEIKHILYADKATLSGIFIMDMLVAGVLLILSVCLILIAFTVLQFTIRLTLDEEYSQIGIMKAVGIPPHKIGRLYSIKYMAVAAAGSVVGLVLSIPFGDMLLDTVSKNMVLESAGGYFINIIMAITVCLVVILFCRLCTRRVNRISPIQAIRQGSNGERYGRKGLISLSKSRMPLTLALSVNSIFNNIKKYGIMLFAFTLGTILLCLIVNNINTLRGSNLLRFFGMAECDVCLSESAIGVAMDSNSQKLDEHLAYVRDFCEENDMEAEIFKEALYIAKISYNGRDSLIYPQKSVAGTSTDEYDYVEGTAPKHSNEIAITHLVADRLDVHIGDTVTLSLVDGSKDYIVTAIFQSMVNRGLMARLSENDEISDVNIGGYLATQIRYTDNPDANTREERKKLFEENFPNYDVKNAGEYVDSMVGNVAGVLENVRNIILVVVLSINILIVALMMVGFINRERGEISLMKSLGFRDGRIVLSQCIRVGIVLLLSVILGILLVDPVAGISTDYIYNMMGASTISYEINALEVYVIYPLLIFAVTIITAVISAQRVRSVRTDEIRNITD